MIKKISIITILGMFLMSQGIGTAQAYQRSSNKAKFWAIEMPINPEAGFTCDDDNANKVVPDNSAEADPAFAIVISNIDTASPLAGIMYLSVKKSQANWEEIYLTAQSGVLSYAIAMFGYDETNLPQPICGGDKVKLYDIEDFESFGSKMAGH